MIFYIFPLNLYFIDEIDTGKNITLHWKPGKIPKAKDGRCTVLKAENDAEYIDYAPCCIGIKHFICTSQGTLNFHYWLPALKIICSIRSHTNKSQSYNMII